MKNYIHKDYDFVHISEIPFEEIDKIDIAMCKQPTQTVQAYYVDQQTKPDVIMNGGMFIMKTGNTIFSLRDEGKNIAVDYNNTDGFGIIGNKQLEIGRINDGTAYRDFIAAYPVLIKDKKAANTASCSAIDYKTRRSLVGWNKTNFYIITIEKPGMKFSEMQKMLLDMGLEYAANLDGGGSTCKLVYGKKVTTQAYNRPVDNVICVYLTASKPKKLLYRVQLGAFGKAPNASNYLLKIKAAGYHDAFVTFQDNLYKIQLGAFSVKDNATRLVNELKAKGFTAFIVSVRV